MGSQKRRKDQEDNSASQLGRKKSRSLSNGPNCSYQDNVRLGMVEKVTLKNFMCHSNLEFDFGSDARVHFITGRNGSGKSAVLNGIILALGGKSSVTQRNTNIKNFVQTGKHVADIAVTLCNVGEESYKPEEYGNKITISRRITDDGISSYKILNENGKVVSTKKEEINNILNALNVQIDNPVCVLTQESSRNFLDSRDPKKKYIFFNKATQLEQIWQQYVEADEKRRDAKDSLDKKSSALDDLFKELAKWKEQAKVLEGIDQKRKEIRAIENQIAWALVMRLEEEEEKLRQAIKMVKAEKEKTKILIADASKKLDECEEKKKSLYDTQEEIKDEVKGKKETLELSYREYDKLNKELKANKSKIDRLAKEIDNEEKQIEILKKSIEELQARSHRDIDEEKKMRDIQIQELDTENEEWKALLDEKIDSAAEIKNREEEFKRRSNELQGEMMEIQQKVRDYEKDLQRMRSTQKNVEYLFGNRVPELKTKIEDALGRRVFKCKPIGPIGLYVKVRDQKWAYAIERFVGAPLLQSYCCDNMNDRIELMKIMKSVYRAEKLPPIIVSPFLNQAHNVQHNMAESNYPTVCQMIECSDPVVFNCLVDQRSIENVILIEKSEEASRVMMDNAPRKCASAFTIEADQLYPYPNYRYYSCRGSKDVYYLKQSYTEENIRAKNAEVNELHKQKRSRTDEKNRSELQAAECRSHLQRTNQEVRQTRQKISLNEQQIRSLRITEKPTDVSAQEEELRQRVSDQDKIKEEKECLITEYKSLRQEKSEWEAKVKEAEECCKQKRRELDTLLPCIQEAEMKYEKLRLEKEQRKMKLKTEVQKLEQIEKNLTDAEDETQKHISAANQICPKIRVERSAESLYREKRELEGVLQDYTKFSPSEIKNIQRNVVEKKAKFDELFNVINELNTLIKRLKKQIKNRMDKYLKLQSALCLQIRLLFGMSMTVRKYVGSISFDHDNESLEIVANPRNEKNYLSANALSGGERSFVTVSFLLALFDVAMMPFHILDEYDVFMDKTNKESSMQLMMQKAKEKHRNQFIFITPLDISPQMVDESLVKIHRMLDPERRITKT